MDLPDLELELFKAYRAARRHKRDTKSQLRFEAALEREILSLARELHDRTYELSPSICFIHRGAVKREVVAAAFRDRVVHHLLWNWISPIFERQFIFDSYSCRKGKGTLFGIRRVAGFFRAESDDFRRECYVLKLDISGFFMAIRQDVLYGLVLSGLEKAHFAEIPDAPLCKYLLKKIIFDNPLDRAVFRSPRSAWWDLPQNKSLRFSPAGSGLPIGNLTSQLFGNVYLNPLDHFVKRTLKVRHYGRYVDDMVLVCRDRKFLLSCVGTLRSFLWKSLGLKLHPRKISIQPVVSGIPFLGAFVLPWRIYLGRRSVQNFWRCILYPDPDPCRQRHREISYRGMMWHFQGGGAMADQKCEAAAFSA